MVRQYGLNGMIKKMLGISPRHPAPSEILRDLKELEENVLPRHSLDIAIEGYMPAPAGASESTFWVSFEP